MPKIYNFWWGSGIFLYRMQDLDKIIIDRVEEIRYNVPN